MIVKQLEKRTDELFKASDKAIEKAELASDRRFEGLNELRKMASDWRVEFARKDAVDVQIKSLDDKLSAISEWQSRFVGGLVLSRCQIQHATNLLAH